MEFVRDKFASGSPDEVVAVGGNVMGAVIITWDRDFKKLIRRMPKGTHRALKNLGRISFCCSEPLGRKRIEELIDSIEFEYTQVQRFPDRRLIMQISETSFTVSR